MTSSRMPLEKLASATTRFFHVGRTNITHEETNGKLFSRTSDSSGEIVLFIARNDATFRFLPCILRSLHLLAFLLILDCSIEIQNAWNVRSDTQMEWYDLLDLRNDACTNKRDSKEERIARKNHAFSCLCFSTIRRETHRLETNASLPSMHLQT